MSNIGAPSQHPPKNSTNNQPNNTPVLANTLPKELSSLFVDKDQYKYLSKPLTKDQLREAKKLIDHKIELNNSLPKEQAYLDKEGNLKVAKVTRYIPTNLILTKDGQLVLKNPQQQVDYMNFIGEPLDTNTNTETKRINNNNNNNNININKLNRLMQKVNNLSMNNTNNNPFLNNTSNEEINLTNGNNNANNNHSQLNNRSNPFLSPGSPLSASRPNRSAHNELPKSQSTQVDDSNRSNSNSITYDQMIQQQQQLILNTSTSIITKSSTESVTSSTFIENNFPVFSNLNNPDFKLPKQANVYNSNNNNINNSNNTKQAKTGGSSKRLLSNLNKKLKTTTNGSSSSNNKDFPPLSPTSKNFNWDNIDIKTYEGLLPWEKHVELMEWIDPIPAYPPSYNKCNPQALSGNIQYPIFEEAHDPAITAPPNYKPGIEGITIVAMKVEFLSPFDKAMLRHWKYYIFELNSTQINFYHLDDDLTKDIPNYKDGKDDSCQIREKEKRNDFSSYSDHYQIINGKKVWLNNANGNHSSNNNNNNVNTNSTSNNKNGVEEYIMSKLESREILQKVMENPAKYLTNEKLCKSFSLQNNDFGIATDCNERPYILRLRSEMEQFLLSFSNVMDMINWSVYLSVGIGISLDLDERNYPNYRIVPIGSSRSRRRRRRLLREERRQRLLLEQQEQLDIYSQQNLKKYQQQQQQNQHLVPHKTSILNFSRLRTSSISSLSHNYTSGANLEALERRRSSLANLNDSLLQDESSSLLELCSTIEAERRRRMSNNQSLQSFDSLLYNLSPSGTNGAIDDTESSAVDDDEEEEDDDDFNRNGLAHDENIDEAITETEQLNENGDTVFPMIDNDIRQIERENRKLMEHYTSLTIKRVLREDEKEEKTLKQTLNPNMQSSPTNSNDSPENLDRNNPALLLTHALTTIQFAPDKKKTRSSSEFNRTQSRDSENSQGSNGNSVKKLRSTHSVLNLLGTSTDNTKNNKSSKKLISKLFSKKSFSSSNTEKVTKKKDTKENTSPVKLHKNGTEITVDSLITAAPTERRQSLVSVKREARPSLSPPIVTNNTVKNVKKETNIDQPISNKPTNQVADSIERNILDTERQIMEEELQLENLSPEDEEEEEDIRDVVEEDEGENKIITTAGEDLENDENRMNTYEREGLQFEEVGDYVYFPQKTNTPQQQIIRARSNSNAPSEVSPGKNTHNNSLRQVFTNESVRRRSESIHSQISYPIKNNNNVLTNKQEKYIWAPPRKIMTKKKYIREAIGCIKPLLENETWHGKVISTPCLAPMYDTNNPPISGILKELEKVDAINEKNASLFKYGFSQHDGKNKPRFKLILRRCKNHYLKQSVVGPSGYVRL
ncbi:hypothetical protein ACO0SA_001544 [Hanseniaspora valbyensis]